MTVTPDSGYQLDTLSIKDVAGKTVAYTNNGSNSYTFTMLSGKVMVSASFTENGTFR